MSHKPLSSRLKRVLAKLAGGCNYDVRQGYHYPFKGASAVVARLDFVDGRVRLPSLGDGSHTALLKIRVRSSLPGLLVFPKVFISSGEKSEVQYLERGSKGERYIDITSFLSSDGAELALRSAHLEIEKDSVELILFKNDLPQNPTVLVIAPHPDDAEIAGYGFYSGLDNVYIVTVTAGDAGPFNYDRIYADSKEHYLKKGQLRTWNSITVPMLCGIPPERAINLGFFDGTLKQMFENRDSVVQGIHTGISDISTYRRQNMSPLADSLDGDASWNSLVSNLARLFREIKPDIVLTPHPVLDGLDDHRYATKAVFEALTAAERLDGKILFYVNHCMFNELYPYGPMGSLVSLPPSCGEAIPFSSIYSHVLSPETQRDKLFAMEAMNDLRMNTDRRFSKGATRAALKAPLKELLGYDDSYYRRAVRRNELFFVAGFEAVRSEKIPSNGKS